MDAGVEELRTRLDTWVKRGSAFTKGKDVAVAMARLGVSKDAIVGAEHLGEIFFYEVHELYSKTLIPAGRQSRTFESIIKRAKLIVKSYTAFGACFARIVRASLSGTNEKGLNGNGDGGLQLAQSTESIRLC